MKKINEDVLNEHVKQDELVERFQEALKNSKASSFANISKADVKEAVNAFYDVVYDFLVEGRRLQFKKSGTFSLKARPKKTYRNPANNEVFERAESAYVSFSPALNLKTALRDDHKLALAILKKEAAAKKARAKVAKKPAKKK